MNDIENRVTTYWDQIDIRRQREVHFCQDKDE